MVFILCTVMQKQMVGYKKMNEAKIYLASFLQEWKKVVFPTKKELCKSLIILVVGLVIFLSIVILADKLGDFGLSMFFKLKKGE